MGQVIKSAAVGEVIESRSPKFQPGDVVTGMFGWRLHDVAKAETLMKVVPGVSPTTALGVLGRHRLDCLLRTTRNRSAQRRRDGGRVRCGGRSRHVVCQIAKIKGCRVVGIAGSDEKNEYLTP